MTHFSLFSGIGGLDLAAEWAGFQTVGQCEISDYPTRVLEKHWPDVPRWRDIRDVTAKSFWERTGIKSPTVLSGGFPCQPHSLAGKRKGSSDEHDLWGEFARVICDLNPRWVVAENVTGLLSSETGRYYGRILRDMAEMGYRIGWCSYPASWVGAVHKRERIFIIAYAHSIRVERQRPKQQTAGPYKYSRLHGCHAEPGICRVDYGFPAQMDRIKCLGNAVVPQQAYPIFLSIADVERAKPPAKIT